MRVLAALVSAFSLPFGGNWAAVVPSGADVTVWGPAAIRGADCVDVVVDAATMRGSALRRLSCTAAFGIGHRIVPSIHYVGHSNNALLRVGRTSFVFGDYSDTKPAWAYGAGSLWVYDVATTRGPLLLRLSARTGRLLRSVRMPKLYRPVLAADADGLWLGVGTSGGYPGPGPAPIYHVATGHGGAVVVHREGRGALWLLARGHRLFGELVSGRSRDRIWRFDGDTATPTLLVRRPPAPAASATYGNGKLWAYGWTAGCRRVRLFSIDPLNGRVVIAATVASLDVCGGPGAGGSPASPIAYAHGALFFLNGPKLFRVSLR
jgi:hypothetical protein